jgi:hypothetical protein
MTISFTNQVLCYCLGGGSLSLRGRLSRPWLELIRPEMEMTYLRHQLRLLREAHGQSLQVVYDTLPGQEPYGRVRARLQSESLWRAYEILYPWDQRCITPAILDMTGLAGFVSLWLDRGERKPASAVIRLGRGWPEPAQLEAWLQGLGHSGEARRSDKGLTSLHWQSEAAKELMRALRRDVHPSRRTSTWPRATRLWESHRGRD